MDVACDLGPSTTPTTTELRPSTTIKVIESTTTAPATTTTATIVPHDTSGGTISTGLTMTPKSTLSSTTTNLPTTLRGIAATATIAPSVSSGTPSVVPTFRPTIRVRSSSAPTAAAVLSTPWGDGPTIVLASAAAVTVLIVGVLAFLETA
ncbi:Aste57867_16505 [Aphanomyces stellatus]|uniref:Aste57867_16505 protein n=1 Tax=Aphanomyces stellatus TaxID=120398 RepID=A0A485L8S4_9STRA|nr:hypothetical protein As57867_016448 [Aphanomyces stellatus]VFT93279.1 Aste57867_16505 [Aphanomyces stellatus]